MGARPPRPAAREAEPYSSPTAFRADLLAMGHALAEAGGGLLASGGVIGRLIRAVEVFGFHLATLDLRQNSAVHERVVGELLARAGVCDDYAALDEEARVSLLNRELATARPLASRFITYSDETAKELAIVAAAAEAHATYGNACIRQYIVSMCTSVSDLLEVHLLLKEVACMCPAIRRRRM